MGRLLTGFVAALMTLLASGCGDAPAGKPPLVLAASSLQDAMEDAAAAWQAKGHPMPTLSFAATSALARQIEAGAPADIFVSADEKWMDEIDGKGLVRPGTRADAFANRLALVAPADSTLTLSIGQGFALAQALGDARLAMADPDAVPAGRYGREALTSLGAWDDVADKVVRAENVRAALALVARKEAALGIVYATDALAEPGVRVLGTFPEGSHTPIVYPLAVLKTATSNDAEAFREFLLSDEAMTIFREAGFEAGRAAP